MNATLVREEQIKTTDESIECILSRLETADNKGKNEIENMLVSYGHNAVPELVNQLQIVKGSIRGIVAMILIRIGEPSVGCLKEAARANKEFEWVAKYIITEIKGIAA